MLLKTRVLVVSDTQKELTPEEIEEREIERSYREAQRLISGKDADEFEMELAYEDIEYEYNDAIVDFNRELIFVDSNGDAVCVLPFSDQVIIEENLDELYKKLNKNIFNKILTFLKLHMSEFFRMFVKQN